MEEQGAQYPYPEEIEKNRLKILFTVYAALLLTSFIVVVLLVFVFANPFPQSISKKEYINTQIGFSIHPPEGWRHVAFNRSGTNGVSFNLNDQSNYEIAVIAVTEPGTSALPDVEQTGNYLELEMSNQKSRYVLKGKSITTINAREAYQFEFSFLDEVNQIRRMKISALINERTLYLISAQATEKDWSKLEPVANKSIATFTIK